MNSRFHPLFAPSSRCWLVAWLVAAVLCTQWSGLHHRIEHGGLAHVAMPSQSVTPDLDHDLPHREDAHHSCVLFDGLTLTDAGTLLPPQLPLLPGTRVLALWTAYASWDAPPLCHFSPRAPPSN